MFVYTSVYLVSGKLHTSAFSAQLYRLIIAVVVVVSVGVACFCLLINEKISHIVCLMVRYGAAATVIYYPKSTITTLSNIYITLCEVGKFPGFIHFNTFSTQIDNFNNNKKNQHPK